MKNNLPQPFLVNGKIHQLRSFCKDLEEIGYHNNVSIFRNFIYSGLSKVEEKNFRKYYGVFKQFFTSNTRLFPEDYVTFNLPEDYSKALEFAKEQIEHESWTIPTRTEFVTVEEMFKFCDFMEKSIFRGTNIDWNNCWTNYKHLKNL